MAELSKNEIAQIVEDFLNDTGQWWDFKKYIEDKVTKPKNLVL